MRMMRGGRQAPRGGGSGYANGGYVTGTGNIVAFSMEDRQLLIDIRNAIANGLTITEGSLQGAVNAGNSNSTGRRVA